MKVYVHEIPPEGLTIDREEDGDRLFEKEQEIRFEGKISLHLVLHLVGQSVTLFGKIGATIFLPCGRCLEEYKSIINKDFSLEYRSVLEISKGGEIELSADEMDVQYYGEGGIDLDEVIMGQVGEGIPLKPLCTDNCCGLCPHCGKNLNQGECSCVAVGTDPRLAVLKDLLKKEDS